MGKSLLLIGAIFLSGCVTIAPPAPMLTYGGPQTTPKGASEAAIAVGSAGALFEGGHSGAQGWFARYKYGLSKRFDIGGDIMGGKRNDGQTLSLKVAGRYQLTEKSRLELGIGAADDSDGKSLNGDAAFTVGTLRDKPWDYYASLRGGFAKGYAGNVIFSDQTQSGDTIPPPDAVYLLANLGIQGKVSTNQRFIIEGGYGYVLPDNDDAAPIFYISAGLVFIIGNRGNED